MTTLSALTAVPGTILATAALTSQEALAAVTDEAVLSSPEEVSNLATVTGMFAVNYYVSSEIADRLIKCARLTAYQTSSYFVKELQRALVDREAIPPCHYSGTMEKIRHSALAVFGHTVPAVSADPVQAGVAAVVEDPLSDSAILDRRDREYIAEKLAMAGYLTRLIEKTAKGDAEAAFRLRLIVKTHQFTEKFTVEDVETLKNIEGNLFAGFEIGRILKVLLKRRPELFSKK